ncbi:MAG: TAXI family TRAP transporter solute-binding subunit [Pontixanthobacter sp.]
MRKYLSLSIAALVATQIYAVSAQAQEQLSIGASGSGTGPYVNGALMADIANKSQDGYRFSVQTTGGYRDNLGLVLSDQVDLALTTLIDLEFAYNGRGDFGELPNKDDFKKLRYVFSFGVVPENFFVREDSGITSMEGIKGKSFNINVPSSFTHGMNLNLLEAADIPLDSFKAGTVATGQVFDEVQNGVFVGGSHVYQLGLASAQRLSATMPIRYIGIPKSVVDKLNEKYFGLLVPFEIPADTYTGQSTPVATFGLAQVVFTDENADEESVYQFTKSFWENLTELQGSNTSFNGMTPALGAKDYGVPMHPGAARYFKEIGAL